MKQYSSHFWHLHLISTIELISKKYDRRKSKINTCKNLNLFLHRAQKGILSLGTNFSIYCVHWCILIITRFWFFKYFCKHDWGCVNTGKSYIHVLCVICNFYIKKNFAYLKYNVLLFLWHSQKLKVWHTQKYLILLQATVSFLDMPF